MGEANAYGMNSEVKEGFLTQDSQLLDGQLRLGTCACRGFGGHREGFRLGVEARESYGRKAGRIEGGGRWLET